MKKILTVIIAALVVTSCHKDGNSNSLVTPGSPTNELLFNNQGSSSYTIYIKGLNEGTIDGHSTRMFTVNTGTYSCEARQNNGGNNDWIFTAHVSDVQGSECDFQ